MVSAKKGLAKIKLAILNPTDIKYLKGQREQLNGIVLLIHESKKLGASILLKHMAEELVRQGTNVYIISRTFGELNDEYSKIAPTQIAVTRGQVQRILRKLKKSGYTKLIANTAACGDCVKIAKVEGYKVISLIHELAMVIQYLNLEKQTKEMLEYSDEIIFSTSIAKDEILQLLNMKDERIRVMPQGVYYKKPSGQIIAQEMNKLLLNYPQIKAKKIVIGVGNTSKRKGFDIFLDVATGMPDVYFLWAGKKENYYNQVAFAKDIKEPDNFIFLGQMNSEQLSGLYSIADVLLMCSRKDTLPSIIFEALLFGVPVIGSKDSGGIVDVINEDNGMLTETVNVQNFIDALNNMLNEERLEKIKGNIIRNNSSDYSFVDYISFIKNQFKLCEEDVVNGGY